MIICVQCFKDNALKSIIKSAGVIGTCEICGKKDNYIYNTKNDKYLREYFEEVLDVYTCKDDLPSEYPQDQLGWIDEKINNSWNIFNLDKKYVRQVLIEICGENYYEASKIFTQPVGIEELFDKDYMENNCVLRNYSWESFKNSLRRINRFHSDHINTVILEKLCNSLSIKLDKGIELYRARISTKDGFCSNEMGIPPENLISAGRANSEGIGCLYLSDNIITTLHEIRARDLDYVSIGTFKLKKRINIVDLSYIDELSPFLTDSNLTWFAINIEYLKKMGKEIAKPLRRQDSILDYLPTQYISDFVKHKGYEGIKYRSTLNEGGNNFAIFNEKHFKCTKVDVYHVNQLEYEIKKM